MDAGDAGAQLGLELRQLRTAEHGRDDRVRALEEVVDDLDLLRAGAEAGECVDEALQPVVVLDDLLGRSLVERVGLVVDDELGRIRGFVSSYCDSDLAARVAALNGVEKERHFTFEHDGVLLHGFVDAMHLDGEEALVVDYKTNLLGDASPEEIVEHDYRLQRLVYALACFRAGADRVEVVYHFLERADAVVPSLFTREQLPALEAELSAGIERIKAGEFRPTPSEFACSTCPALVLVCAGPRLRNASAALQLSAS